MAWPGDGPAHRTDTPGRRPRTRRVASIVLVVIAVGLAGCTQYVIPRPPEAFPAEGWMVAFRNSDGGGWQSFQGDNFSVRAPDPWWGAFGQKTVTAAEPIEVEYRVSGSMSYASLYWHNDEADPYHGVVFREAWRARPTEAGVNGTFVLPPGENQVTLMVDPPKGALDRVEDTADLLAPLEVHVWWYVTVLS